MPRVSIPYRAVSILATVCLFASCGPSLRDHPVTGRALEVYPCEGFQLREDIPFPIDVDSMGGRIELGGGNWIEFAHNAVNDSVRFQVSYLMRGPRPGKKAGIEIRRLGPPVQFKEPVRIHISYAACTDFPEAASKEMVKFPGNSGNDYHWLSGAMSENGQYVEVLVNDFSGFAIAI